MNRLLYWRPGRAFHGKTLLIVTLGVLASFVAAYYSADLEQGIYPRPLVGVVVLAGALILFSVEPERLLLAWLLVAPLLQGLPDRSWGHAMWLAVYLVPALALAVLTIVVRGRRSTVAWFDFLPAAWVLLVIASLALTTQLLNTQTSSSLKAVFQTTALGPLLYYFVVFAAKGVLTATRVVRVLLVACALEAAMAIIEFPTKWTLWGEDGGWHGNDISRSVATLQNPAVLGGFLGAGLALALAVLAWDGPQELRRLSLVVVVLTLPAIVFTFTRGPIAAAAAVGLLIVLLKGRTRFASIGMVAAAALAFVIAWPTITKSNIYQNRVTNSRNVEARVVLQDWSLRLWKEKPILGWGYQSFDRVKNTANFSAGGLPVQLGLTSTSHDTYLTVLVEYGGLGLLLMLGPFAVILVRSLRRARAPSSDRWLLVGGSGAILAIMLTGATIDYRFFSMLPAVLWLLLGLLRRVISPQDTRTSTS